MATQIRPNRLEVSDRFPMLGFTVRTDGGAKRYEIAIGTSPDLFGQSGKPQRTRSNFYSTRASGPLPIERGEAVFVLPPEVLARFVGQQKLYYGLATYTNGLGSAELVSVPASGSPYINVSGLTGRSLQRIRVLPSRQRVASGYGANGSEMEWAGDAATPGTQPVQPPASKQDADKTAAAPAGSEPVHYDDGYGPLPPPPTAEAPKAQAKSLGDESEQEDDAHGIDGPIPDEETAAMGLSRPMSLSPEYPQGSRFEPAASVNYKTVSGTRTINRVVIHITDGGSKASGTINWFQNPNQLNAKGKPIHVSAHYVIGQDGEVVQMVKHNDVAWHASAANGDSIGIEHVARSPHAFDKPGKPDPGLMPTEAQYCASAALVNWLCTQFNIPMDRDHVLGHSEASPRDHHDGCPNSVWDWDYYMGMVTSGSCEPRAAAASLGYQKPKAKAMKQVDAGYAPGNTQDALTYQKQFQDRKQAWKAGVPDTTFFPHSAICRLRIFQSDGEYIGTGFYIANDRILTCGHNLENATDVTIIPGKNDSAEPFGAFSARPADWVIHPKYQPGGNGDFDLAVIKTTIPPPNGGAFTNLEELLECQESPIIVCGYAADTVNKDKQHLDGDAIRMLSDSGETFLYNLQTEPGNSGSPVYYVTERDDEVRQQCVIETRLIGVHIASVTGSNVFNRGCRLTADKIAWINSIGKAASFAAAVQAQSHSRSYGPAAGVRSAMSMQAAASTTSGVGDADDTTHNLTCIQGLKDQGRSISFVQRYLRTLTATEAANISNAGLSIVSCHEIGNPTKASYFTRAQGKKDGRTAFGQAQNAGQPAGTPIYFAVDYDAGTRERQNIEDYFQGVQEGCAQFIADMEANGTPAVVYDIGVYGSACVLDWCQQQGIATWFWQAFAPGWCNNRQVWENANLHTTGLDTPVRCGLRLDHLEGWGNEGGWTTTAAAQGQSLSFSLPAAPRSKRYAKGEAIDSSPRQIGDTAVTTIAGGTGNVTWELDQFAGVKMAAQTAAAPLQSGETIQLANWPYCDYPDGSRAAAWFTVDWRYSGQAIGNVRITPTGSQQGPQPLAVEARIEDANAKEPNTAALLVRFTYRFSTAEGQGVVANTELTLYSDGSIDQKSNWTARAAA